MFQIIKSERLNLPSIMNIFSMDSFFTIFLINKKICDKINIAINVVIMARITKSHINTFLLIPQANMLISGK